MINTQALTTITTDNYSKEAVSVFNEYNDSIQKLDIILLIVAPSAIIGLGLFYYLKKTKRIK